MIKENVNKIITLREATADLKKIMLEVSQVVNIDNPSGINLDGPSGDIPFWAEQMSEHMLFFSWGLQDKDLRNTSKRLRSQWENWRAGNQEDGDRLRTLLDATEQLKTEVIDRQKAGEWVGWLHPLFPDHVRRELRFFKDKLNEKQFSSKQELQIWSTLIGEHQLFVDKLLDPKETKTADLARTLANTLLKEVRPITVSEEGLDPVKTAAQESDKLLTLASDVTRTGKIKSVLHPTLVDHVVREGRRFLDLIDSVTTE